VAHEDETVCVSALALVADGKAKHTPTLFELHLVRHFLQHATKATSPAFRQKARVQVCFNAVASSAKSS
jgi:hypothetical protein